MPQDPMISMNVNKSSKASLTMRMFKEDDAVFVMNTSHLPNSAGQPTEVWGDVVISVYSEEEKAMVPVIIPKTTNPVELTSQAPLVALKSATRLTAMLSRGVITLISEDDAQRILRSPAGITEAQRLQRWRRGEEMVNGVYVNSRLNLKSPDATQTEAPKVKDSTNSTIDILISLVDNVQAGRMTDENAIKALTGIAPLFTDEQLEEFMQNNLPRVLVTGLQNILADRA